MDFIWLTRFIQYNFITIKIETYNSERMSLNIPAKDGIRCEKAFYDC